MNALLQAEQDLSDINTLRNVQGFQRYFLRRLQEKKSHFASLVLSSEGTHEEREIWRQIYLEYDSLCGLVDQDEANARKLLTRRE